VEHVELFYDSVQHDHLYFYPSFAADSVLALALNPKSYSEGSDMPVKSPVLVKAEGPARIKSQEELDKVFARVQAAARKQRSADALHALEVYNKVVADGHHIKEFMSEPARVAEKLGLKLSPPEAARITAAHGLTGGEVADTVELVAVAIIVLVLADVPDRELVIDTAGIIKV